MNMDQSSWEEVSQRMSHVTDALGKPIDPGIFDTVVALNILGFSTTMSCEGHFERGIAGPWVDLQAPGVNQLRAQMKAKQREAYPDQQGPHPLSDEAKSLYCEIEKMQLEMAQSFLVLLERFYAQREYTSYDQRLIPRMWGTVAGRVRLECLGTALQDIADSETKARKLKMYQWEMNEFTKFLKSLIV